MSARNPCVQTSRSSDDLLSWMFWFLLPAAPHPKNNKKFVAVGVVVVVVVVVMFLRILKVLLKYPTVFLRVASATNLTAADNACLWQGSWGVYTWSWDTHVGTENLRSSSN